MDPNDPRWLQHLDIVTAWGEASARNGTPRPTDEQLWSTARRRQDLNLPEQIDADLLAELREAFNAGRHPTRIDLHAVADALHARGHHAAVEHTGGNTATLYAGRQVPDRNGDPRWSVAAGPGWFDAPGHRQPVADTSELHVGPDSDDTWAVAVPEHATTRQITDVIIAVIDHVEAQRSRFAAAADAARCFHQVVLAPLLQEVLDPPAPLHANASMGTPALLGPTCPEIRDGHQGGCGPTRRRRNPPAVRRCRSAERRWGTGTRWQAGRRPARQLFGRDPRGAVGPR